MSIIPREPATMTDNGGDVHPFFKIHTAPNWSVSHAKSLSLMAHGTFPAYDAHEYRPNISKGYTGLKCVDKFGDS